MLHLYEEFTHIKVYCQMISIEMNHRQLLHVLNPIRHRAVLSRCRIDSAFHSEVMEDFLENVLTIELN